MTDPYVSQHQRGKPIFKRIFTATLMLASASVNADLIHQQVEYSADDTTLKGYIAYDDAIEESVGGTP